MKIVSSLNNPAMKKLQIRDDGYEVGTINITLWESDRTLWESDREYNSGITVSRAELLEALNAQEKPEPPFEFPTEFGSIIARTNDRKYVLGEDGYWLNFESGKKYPVSHLGDSGWTVLRNGL